MNTEKQNHNFKVQDQLKKKLWTINHLHHKDYPIEAKTKFKIKLIISWLTSEFIPIYLLKYF